MRQLIKFSLYVSAIEEPCTRKMLSTSQLFHLTVITLCIDVSSCQRRMAKQNYTTVDKRYMVYLIQSNQSYPKYKAWLCGGALVRTDKVLTSAACLIESSNIYVIAGYSKYVSTAELDNDNCTRVLKRRVIKTCVPHGYDFDRYNATTWMTLDIGVAVVDRRYRSTDIMFRLLCDYIPKPIPILYHKDVTYAQMDVLTFGWGFLRGRRPGDPGDYNSKMLKYASTTLQDPVECKKNFTDMDDIIDKYMLCTKYNGGMDDDGRQQLVFAARRLNCSRRHLTAEECDSLERNADTRRQVIFNTGKGNQGFGICQNDHGGPLVAYIGVTEMLIGVAVNTIYDTSYQCIGPSLFTSTACTSEIIMCMLTNSLETRRTYEQVIKKDGIEIKWTNVEWEDEPAESRSPRPDTNSTPDETTSHSNVTTEAIAYNSTLQLLNNNTRPSTTYVLPSKNQED